MVDRVASAVPWSQVCRMLDKVTTATRQNKKDTLIRFIKQYRALLSKNKDQYPATGSSFFPVLRILLPSLDRDRGAYGVKERKLADLYIRILGLKKESTDAQKLINYRKPKVAGTSSVGDFAEVAFYVLKNRCPKEGKLALSDVDFQLTSIAENYANKCHDSVDRSMLSMLRSMSATEQKWLIRVMLKDMHLGIGQVAIFGAWHPDAKDYYDVTNSLLKVCTTLQDPSTRLHEIEISLFLPFRPMLAERAVLEKVETQMKNKTHYAETKFDGERSQIHKKGNEYKYFSRNGFDFTENFGRYPNAGLFTPHLHQLFKPHVKDVILDGEVICWSKRHEVIVSKSEHMDVRNLKDDGDLQVCLCVFDVLLLNGRVLTNLPLKERLKILRTLATPMPGRLHITDWEEVHNKEDVITVLNSAIDRREEGIVLKDPDSVYRPASRKAGWIKVKPDYVDALIPEMDLLIIGGYYGTGRRRGILSHFLLAVTVPPENTGDKPTTFHSVTKVASGYTSTELEELLARVTPHTVARQPPGVLVTREKPDVWFNPSKSCVVQVRAAELVKSDGYKTGITLRFPRVEAVRADKPWYDTLTTTELEQLHQEAAGKLSTKHYISGEDGASPAKRRAFQHEQPSLPLHFRPADISTVVKKGEVFTGLELCVMEGCDDHSKQQLELMVAEGGGTLSQHPGPKTYCIISNSKSVRVRNYIKRGGHSVIRPRWLVSCMALQRLLPWGPLDVVHIQEDQRAKMESQFDCYGDSYFDEVDGSSLKYIMDRMKPSKRLSVDELRELEDAVASPGDLYGLFRPVVACCVDEAGNAVEPEELNLTLLKFRLYGGQLRNEVTADVTHLIVLNNSSCALRWLQQDGRHLVKESWIHRCVEEGKLLTERHHMPDKI